MRDRMARQTIAQKQAQADLATLPDNTIYQPKGIDIDQLRELRAKGLSYSQVAKVAGCSKANVIFRLEGWQTDHDDAETFKGCESDILNALRLRIVRSITESDIKSMAPRDRVVAYGILYDKYRLESNQTTENHGYKGMMVQAMASLQDLKSLESSLGKSDNVLE
jgi:hypothetical protein